MGPVIRRSLASAATFGAFAIASAPAALHAQERRDTLMFGSQDATGPTAPGTTGDHVLDSLVADALERSPQLQAAASRIAASRARILPAGTRSDPVISAGLIQLPVRKPSLTDDSFTMLMVGVTQTIPYPGKLALRSRAARLDAHAVSTTRDAARLAVVRAVKDAYYEVAFATEAIAIAARSQAVLVAVARVSEALYGTGKGEQQDVLKARVETAKLAETASTLAEAHRAALAQLNAARDRPSDTPVPRATIPERVAHAAIAADVSSVRFTSTALGARVSNSPFVSLATLQAGALRNSPMLLEHEARIAAQAARVESARRDGKPDFDVTLQYNHRVAYPDLVTAQVSFPLRLQRSSKQDQAIVEASAELSALEADHLADVNVVRARVATLLSELERDRAQLALYVTAILPQSRGGVTSALASFQGGRASLLSVLDLQNTVFTHETSYYRVLTDFAKGVAELEQLTGMEVVR